MKKRIVCLTLALMMTATQVVSVSASREDELREEQAATSAQLDATYAQIDQLYSAKQQLQDEINSLDANLVNVMVSIQTLEGDISNKEADIQQTQADLQKAQNAKDKQYAAMKQRIQYLYEKGGNEAWFQMMMSADNLSDLLTKAEYTQKMYDYDRQSLEKYANTITQVTNLGNQYQQEKAELIFNGSFNFLMTQGKTNVIQIPSFFSSFLCKIMSKLMRMGIDIRFFG